MKAFLIISTVIHFFFSNAFSQCPKTGLTIQSAVCESPGKLTVDTITCSILKVKWTGSKNQTYRIKATSTDPATSSISDAKVSQRGCDNNGRCSATIAVKEGVRISWSVQTICVAEGATLYSDEVNGSEVNIPLCDKANPNPAISSMQVYPNPASDYLMVAYAGSMAGAVEFRVFDVTGKKVLARPGDTSIKTGGRCTLDIHILPPGLYLLEAANGKEISQAKFVVLRN